MIEIKSKAELQVVLNRAVRCVAVLVALAALNACSTTMDSVKSSVSEIMEKRSLQSKKSLSDDNVVTVSSNPEQERIAAIQGNLKALGFYSGPTDGKLSAVTEAAIQDFQLEHNLTIDGRPSESFLEVTKQKVEDLSS